MHQLALSDNASFWVDTGPLGSKDDIAPFVGIRHDAVESLLSELMAMEGDPWVGTAGANVGVVNGEAYASWQGSSALLAVLASIERAQKRFETLARLEDLPKVWDSLGRDDPWWRYREIVALYVLDRRDSIEGLLAQAHGEYCRRADEICDQFQTFANNLRYRL